MRSSAIIEAMAYLFGASNTGKLLYNPRALPIRFACDPSIGLKITFGAVSS